MASLKEIRVRIASVNSTRQITSAMKMVSAAKLRRAQDAIIQLRPYAKKLHEIFTSLSDNLDGSENVFGKVRPIKRVLLVVITSNKGLCGAFNSNVIKKSLQLIHQDFALQNKSGMLNIMAIGKKGHDYFRQRNYRVISNNSHLFDKLSFSNTSPVVQEIMDSFLNEQYDRIILVYNQFKNAAVQLLVDEQFLPVLPPKKEQSKSSGNQYDYIYEPSKVDIITELVPKSLKIQFYKALLDSHAAEFGARMTAMHKATDNASEMLKTLNLTYNKARQASITKELTEIVGGAEALKK
jgi:F-type H+-transporting ATPase subunit gamma